MAGGGRGTHCWGRAAEARGCGAGWLSESNTPRATLLAADASEEDSTGYYLLVAT